MVTPLRKILILAKWVGIGVGALLGIAIVVGLGGYGRARRTDVTEQKAYADYIGRDYRIVGNVSAYAWNDFPDKDKILSITLTPPPGTRNRFVSYVVPMKRGQRVHILRAWRSYTLVEIIRDYVVVVPDAGLPPGVEIRMRVGADGIPDRHIYEPINDL